MRQKMPLQFGLLRKRFMRPMASLPAAVVPITLGTVHSRHVTGDEMFLERTSVGKRRPAGVFNSMVSCRPFADVQILVHRRELGACDHR